MIKNKQNVGTGVFERRLLTIGLVGGGLGGLMGQRNFIIKPKNQFLHCVIQLA